MAGGGAPAHNLAHYTPACEYCLAAVKDIAFIPRLWCGRVQPDLCTNCCASAQLGKFITLPLLDILWSGQSMLA